MSKSAHQAKYGSEVATELVLETGIMQLVVGGSFWMGSNDDDAPSCEKPCHEVEVGAFYIDRFPVTNERYAQFCSQTGYRTVAERVGFAKVFKDRQWTTLDGASWLHPLGPESSIAGMADHPVVLVTTEDAMRYCAWRSGVEGRDFRLPTEAEWEKAARGTDRRRYPWGDAVVDEGGVLRARYNDGTPQSTAPVGSYPAGVSFHGLHDMGGNTWEWCLDAHDPDYYHRAPSKDTGGPLSLSVESTFRGGSWIFPADVLRATARHANNMMRPSSGIGFRTVAPLHDSLQIRLRNALRSLAQYLALRQYERASRHAPPKAT